MTNKKMLIAAILLVSAVVLMAGCAGQSKTVKAGNNVTVDYTGWFDDGTVFDTSNASVAYQSGIYDPTQTYAPISFIVGQNEVIGDRRRGRRMKVGESKNITIEAKDAYGNMTRR
jgi:peptidylprolyl isomerase